MAVITRLSRLFTADFHAVLDRMEEPDLLLKQAVREMSEEIAAGEQKIKWLGQEIEDASSREAGLAQTLKEIGEQLDICFKAAQDELARKLIKRQLQTRQQQKHIAAKHRALEKELQDFQRAFEENRQRYESMKQKAELFEGSDSSRSGQKFSTWTDDHFAVRDEDVEIAFLREKQSRRQP